MNRAGFFALWPRAAALLAVFLIGAATPVPSIRILSGTLSDGSAYGIGVPANWNGTLILYSHGYYVTYEPFDVRRVVLGDPGIAALMRRGFAVAASAYVHQGYAVAPALSEQMELLQLIPARAGISPKHTIAMGDSMGGDISVALVQLHPDRFAGAVPVCGVVDGLRPLLDRTAMAMLAGNALLGLPYPHERRLAQVASMAKQMVPPLEAAQKTPSGRARIALIAALQEIPGWNPTTLGPPEPNPQSIEANQLVSLEEALPFLYVVADDVNYRAGGIALTTAGEDPGAMLARSPLRATVRAMYAAAGLSLDEDVARIRSARSYATDPRARGYLKRYFDPSGAIAVPVLSLHTIGDHIVPVTAESRYAALVARAGDASFLRQTYVARYGHCLFTPAEIVVTVEALARRIGAGSWGTLSAGSQNARAKALSGLNVLNNKSVHAPAGPSFSSPPR